MITFHTLFGDRLNLNGDQANLFVLQRRLAWQGIDSQVAAIDSVNDLHNIDVNSGFLLIGHGSQAAMRTIEPLASEIRDSVFELAAAGLTGLAVGSGYELLYPDFERGSRLSDYADIPASDELPEIFGYINSDTNLPAVSVLGESFVCTTVHGPVLARSPQLADHLLSQLGIKVIETADAVEADGYALGARAHN